jgi:hypothetical protein
VITITRSPDDHPIPIIEQRTPGHGLAGHLDALWVHPLYPIYRVFITVYVDRGGHLSTIGIQRAATIPEVLPERDQECHSGSHHLVMHVTTIPQG